MPAVILISILANPAGNVGMLFQVENVQYLLLRDNLNSKEESQQISIFDKFRVGLDVCEVKLVPENKSAMIECVREKERRMIILPKCVKDNQILYNAVYNSDLVKHSVRVMCRRKDILL